MKQNKISRSTVLLFLLGAALIVAALIMLVPDLLNYKQSNDTYEALKENYISEKAENTEVAEETEYGQTRETWSEYGGTTLQP